MDKLLAEWLKWSWRRNCHELLEISKQKINNIFPESYLLSFLIHSLYPLFHFSHFFIQRHVRMNILNNHNIQIHTAKMYINSVKWHFPRTTVSWLLIDFLHTL